jgi:putative thiazole/oxazole-modified microcin (TOMM)-like peptide
MMTMFAEAETPIEMDWRFAELVARTWMEPDLAYRYRVDPVPVLAEFGLTVASAADAPRLETIPMVELEIDGLDEADFSYSPPCIKDLTPGLSGDGGPRPNDGLPVVWAS